VEAGKTLLIDRIEFLTEADRQGLTVWGMGAQDEPSAHD
jgi:DUF1009 family protein